jgi:hypothetical protein
MQKEKQKIWVFRMIHVKNLGFILEQGLYYRGSPHKDPSYVSIGSTDIISYRDSVFVKCYPDSWVNDYVPFYFGVRTPMLYKIVTGHGVPKLPQEDIIYLCCKFSDLTQSSLQWCFTDGNAATSITRFYKEADEYVNLDWRSIHSVDWSDDNADGDHDRRRKKHAEFLVKGHVPVGFIKAVMVLTEEKKKLVEEQVQRLGLEITVYIDKERKFYF